MRDGMVMAGGFLGVFFALMGALVVVGVGVKTLLG